MPPRTTIWPLEPHTRGKHLVLKYYMEAWLPILTRWNQRVLFIDAFAGPGEYQGGEPGSPVIALDALIEHRARKQMRGEVVYLFIEKEEDRSNYLKALLKARYNRLPDNCTWEVINSKFDETLPRALDAIEQQQKQSAPAFVMIDPFGLSDTPMRTVATVLANEKSEVYVSFMYEAMNRFVDHPHLERHLDELFGCREWRKAKVMVEDARRDFLFSLYKDQLKSNGAKYVIHFELYEGARLKYAIFFGTGNLLGCNRMKQAIWRVAPMGDFRFRGGQVGQLMLGEAFVDFSQLEVDLNQQFRLQGWQSIDDVEAFVQSDATGFHLGHLRTALRTMEETGNTEVRRPASKDGGTDGGEARQLAFGLNDFAQPRRASRNFPAGTSILFR